MTELKTKIVIGGTPVYNDVSYINKHQPHIIIGTPGRINDLIERNVIKSQEISIVVIDEIDQLLSGMFLNCIQSIVSSMNINAQMAMFTATLPTEILEITKNISKNPVSIIMKNEDVSVAGIDHFYILLYTEYCKYNTIISLFEKSVISQCIIYTNNIQKVIELYDRLIKDDFSVSYIHGDLNEKERKMQFNTFKSGASRILISSNITARGIDIQQVGMVINYDIPYDVHTYLHRVGRSGRYGRKGIAINFVCKHDINNIKNIENYYKISMKEYK
jgi:superfamily II DNA/RNA helicase